MLYQPSLEERICVSSCEAHIPKNNTDLVQSDESTSSPSWADLGQVERDRGRHDAGSCSRNDTADDHHGQMDSASLQCYSDTEDRDASNTSPAAAQTIIEGAAEEDVGEPRALGQFSCATTWQTAARSYQHRRLP
jgi:hypothetical protein